MDALLNETQQHTKFQNKSRKFLDIFGYSVIAFGMSKGFSIPIKHLYLHLLAKLIKNKLLLASPIDFVKYYFT